MLFPNTTLLKLYALPSISLQYSSQTLYISSFSLTSLQECLTYFFFKWGLYQVGYFCWPNQKWTQISESNCISLDGDNLCFSWLLTHSQKYKISILVPDVNPSSLFLHPRTLRISDSSDILYILITGTHSRILQPHEDSLRVIYLNTILYLMMGKSNISINLKIAMQHNWKHLLFWSNDNSSTIHAVLCTVWTYI